MGLSSEKNHIITHNQTPTKKQIASQLPSHTDVTEINTKHKWGIGKDINQ